MDNNSNTPNRLGHRINFYSCDISHYSSMKNEWVFINIIEYNEYISHDSHFCNSPKFQQYNNFFGPKDFIFEEED